MDDQELNRLLREWTAPDAPPASASPPRARVTAALAGHRHDSRTRTRWRSPRCCWSRCGSASTRPGRCSTPETSAPRPSGELARYALTGTLEGFDAVLVEVNFRPGMSSREHRHPGSDPRVRRGGQMRTAIDHSRTRSSRRAARSSSRTAPFIRRSVPRTPDAPVRAVAFLVVPTGSPLTERATTRREP